MTERLRLVGAGLIVLGLGGALWLGLGDPPTGGGEIEAVRSALRTWATFASTGDPAALSATFADGPQRAQLLAEADAITPGRPYQFLLTDAVLVGEGVVEGAVTISRPGETDQIYRWGLDLVREDGVWKVWTVRTMPNSTPGR